MKKEKTLHLAECPYIGRNKWEKSSKKRPPGGGLFFVCSLRLDAAAGQVFLDHQGYLEGDGIVELPQVQAGELFDLL